MLLALAYFPPTLGIVLPFNVSALLFLIWFGKHRQKWTGQITVLYFLCYGIGRFLIEGLRTDQLLIPGTSLAVSQCLSAVLAAAAAIILVIMRFHRKRAR